MKTVHLMRHAKSSWGDDGLDDHARPIAPRGRRAAALMGAWLEQIGASPDRLLCSSARRAQETLDGLHSVWSARPPVSVLDDLYLASAASILERLKRLDDAAGSIFVIGHNPGLHDLACGLVAHGERTLRAALAHGMPTAAHCEIAFDVERWTDLAARTGTLKHFATPKGLV